MPNLSVMIKPSSSICNMRCKYCFYDSLASTRENYSYGIMNDDTSEKLVKSILEYANGGSVSIAFQGGEPLMAGVQFFKSFIEFVKLYNLKSSPISYAMQTNGTLVNDEWIELFKKNKFLIGLSLDGDSNANKFRIDSAKKPVFSRVMQTADKFILSDVDFNVLVVATKYTSKHIKEIYRFLTDKGYKYLQFIPCLRPFGDMSEGELYMNVNDYGNFLVELFKLYADDYKNNRYTSIRWCDNIVGMYYGVPAEQCGIMGHCSTQFVIEGNGDVYPCDFYCSDNWKLGNVTIDDFTVIANSEKASKFVMESLHLPLKCKDCNLLAVCRGGGCKRSRADRDYCKSYKKFYENSLPLFKLFEKEFIRKV